MGAYGRGLGTQNKVRMRKGIRNTEHVEDEKGVSIHRAGAISGPGVCQPSDAMPGTWFLQGASTGGRGNV